jgi:hypothetical protein
MTITTIFVVLLDCLLIILIVFFPLWRQPIQIDTY